MKYDGILFGNGLTINLLQQLKASVAPEKYYLLEIDSFIKRWMDDKVSPREERLVYRAFYGNDCNKQKFYQNIKNKFKSYYSIYNADVEYVMGKLLFVESPYKDVLQCYPILYNIWHIILFDYLLHINCGSYIKHFYETVKTYTGNPQYIWTTNFDLFGESIKPEHLHGRFLTEIKQYADIILEFTNEGKNYYYKYIWGHNGIGKMNNIDEIKKCTNYESYFEFDFFFSNKFKMDKMLIYGMGFRKSGFVEALTKEYPEYETAKFGAIIDEHILARIGGMQNLGMLKCVDVAYYNEREKEHIENAMKEAKVKEYNMIGCQEFEFSIM